jgi:hypothetical protein
MGDWLDKLKNKKKVTSKTNLKGTDGFFDWVQKNFDYKYGKGAHKTSGLDYAKGYDYKPNILEKFLDKVPGVGGHRDYKRAMEYQDRVHFNPEESRASEKAMQRGVNVSTKTMDNISQINNMTTDNRQSSGTISISTEDPRIFSSSLMTQNKDYVGIESSIHGGKSGHYAEDGWNTRGIDPYNIATSEPGSKFLGIFPRNYKGKITSNVAEDGGSKLDPYPNPENLKSQILGNKNLALATKGFYEDKEVWDAKKGMNKAIEASNKRRGYGK